MYEPEQLGGWWYSVNDIENNVEEINLERNNIWLI